MALIDDLLKHLSLSVKKDDLTKKAILLTAASSHSNNPLNLFLKGESGIGKTYNATEALKYFPKHGVWLLGALSPTALVHSYGVLEDENNNEIIQYEDQDGKIKYRYKDGLDISKVEFNDIKKNSHYAVDLRFKILLFLEAPHYETYNYLRPLLSHDAFEITYKFTDKSGKGSLSAKTVILRGWPATIFCTTDAKYMSDLITRSLTISPEETAEKYSEAKKVIASKYMGWKQEDAKLDELKERVRIVLSQFKIHSPPQIFVPFADKLSENFPVKSGGDMRAFDHYLSLIQNSALLNVEDRPVLRHVTHKLPDFCPTAIFATFEDYRLFHEIFLEFAESSRMGIPKKALDLLNKCIVGKGELSVAEIAIEAKKSGINRDARQISLYEIPILRNAGFISESSDPDDKRRKKWEAVGTSELVGSVQKIETWTSLCSFSRFDAQTFLIKIVGSLLNTYMKKQGLPDVVDDAKLTINSDYILKEQINYNKFDSYLGKVMFKLGLNSSLLYINDFLNYLSFPEMNSDKPEEPEKNQDQKIWTDPTNSGKPESSTNNEQTLAKVITWRCPACRAGPFEKAGTIKEHQKICPDFKEYVKEHPNYLG